MAGQGLNGDALVDAKGNPITPIVITHLHRIDPLDIAVVVVAIVLSVGIVGLAILERDIPDALSLPFTTTVGYLTGRTITANRVR